MKTACVVGDRPIRRQRVNQSGFSLVETLFAASMILGGLMVISTGIVRAKMARATAEQQVAAAMTLERAAALLHAGGITGTLQNYAPNGKGDPFPAPGSGAGAAIVAPGLTDPVATSQPALVQVRLFTDETMLRPEVGLPRDLDGDGQINNTDTTRMGADGQPMARVLPFQLSLTFRGAGGGTATATRRGVLTRVR